MAKIHCGECSHELAYITNERARHYCQKKEIWIPQRHYDEGIKKCGKFAPVIVPSDERKGVNV